VPWLRKRIVHMGMLTYIYVRIPPGCAATCEDVASGYDILLSAWGNRGAVELRGKCVD
jgi:hypothetical protein